MKYLLLISLLSLQLLTSCAEDAFGIGYHPYKRGSGSSQGWKTVSGAAVVNALEDGFDDWYHIYDGASFTQDTWTEHDGGTSLPYEAGTKPSANASTSGLTNIGDLTDLAVDVNANVSYGLATNSGFPTIADGQDIHFRALIKVNATVNNTFYYRYVLDANNCIEFAQYGTDTVSHTFRFSNCMGGAKDSCDTSDLLTTCRGSWCLIDAKYDDTGATSATVTIWVNGNQVASCSNATGTSGGLTGDDEFRLLGFSSGGFTPSNSDVLFFGLRPDDGDIDEATHDADCALLGLC